MASVAITRDDLSSAALRAAAAGTADAKQARRLLALAMILDGHPRLLAAQAGGMDRQSLRDWVHRYNAEGVDGLRDVRNKGRSPALSAEQMGTIRMSGVLALARATGVNWPGDASAEANQTGRWSCPVGGQHRRG
jgi:hypothetical protein